MQGRVLRIALILAVAILAAAAAPARASVITADVAEIDFGWGYLDQASETEAVTITNDGDDPLIFTDSELEGADGWSFEREWDNCEGVNLQPDDYCTIGVRLRPRTPGPLQATLRAGHLGSADEVTVELLGTGVREALLEVTPSRLSLPNTPIGSMSRSAFTVRNPASSPATIGVLSGRRAFSPDGPCLGSSLQPGQSCSVGIIFRPGAFLGLIKTELIVQGGAGGQVFVPVEGHGMLKRRAAQVPPVVSAAQLRPVLRRLARSLARLRRSALVKGTSRPLVLPGAGAGRVTIERRRGRRWVSAAKGRFRVGAGGRGRVRLRLARSQRSKPPPRAAKFRLALSFRPSGGRPLTVRMPLSLRRR